jgi:uncharacterized protein
LWTLVFFTNEADDDIALAEGPSVVRGKAAGAVEQMICAADALSALDRKLAEVYAEAAKGAINRP